MPTARKVLEGRTAKLRQEQEIVNDLSRKCKSLRRTSISPIFVGITQALADLRAHGCKEGSGCQLFVDSDFEENAESTIRKSLSRKGSQKRFLPTPVNNNGIHVALCGFAIADRSSPAAPEARKFVLRDAEGIRRMQEVWRSLFTAPALVRLEPYCPTSTELGAHEAVNGRGL